MKRDGAQGALVGVIVFIAIIPLLFVLYNSALLSLDQWRGLWTQRLPQLLWNTFSLAILVAVGCFLLGVSSAWLIARRQFAGRTLAIWLMVLPLAIPTYVFAHIYTSLLESDGWLGRLWLYLSGGSTVPDLYNVWGVALILSLAGFSYVFLLVRSALMHSNQSLEEVARLQGAGSRGVFFRVTLPLLRPAVAASLALVVLHVLSDFGAVSMLRYQTFTLSIYLQMSGRFDYQAAAGLSLVLVLMSVSFLVLERFFRHRQRYYSNSQSRLVQARQASRGELFMIWAWLGLISLFSFVLPLLWMMVWSWEAWFQGVVDSVFWGYVWNSIIIALIAASVAVIMSLPVGLYHARRQTVLSHTFLQLSSVGFALPGPVIALGVMVFALAFMPFLYGSLALLILAVVIRFLPLAVQAQESAIQQITPSVEQAGRILGVGYWGSLWRVTLPMIRGGMVTAWVLVFIDTLKELPATLLLRPVGFDTLPVRIWIESSEEMLELAAPAALMLVVATFPALWILMRSEMKKN